MFGYKKLHLVVLARVWNLASGILLVFVAATVFDLVEQGIFYTFLSLAAAQFFFDLGAGVTIGNITARNVADDDDDSDSFSEHSLTYIRASMHFALKWALVMGGALILIIGSIGSFVLTREAPAAEILPIWLPYVALVGIAMSLHLLLRIFEALGFVVEAALARSAQSFFNIVFLYLLASQGMGVAALPVAFGMGLGLGAFYFFTRSAKIRSAFVALRRTTARIDWRRDILPFQTRMSATWITGYVIFQAQVPILFALAGPEAAGRFGIMVQIFQALNTSANIFLTYNIRPWTQWAATGDATTLHRSLRRTMALTVALMGVGTLMVQAGFWGLGYFAYAMVERFPPIWVMGLYALAATANQVYFCLSYYFRARGEEPLWWLSAAAAIVILAAPVLLGSQFDITAAIATFCGASILILTLGGAFFARWYIRANPLRSVTPSEPS